MDVLLNAAAIVAMIAAIERQTAGGAARWGEAIDCFGQRSRHGLQVLQRTAGEHVGVRQAVPLQAALEQLDDPGLLWKIGEHHSCAVAPGLVSV
jgi:hypothetical protein